MASRRAETYVHQLQKPDDKKKKKKRSRSNPKPRPVDDTPATPAIRTLRDGSTFQFTPFPRIEAPHNLKWEFTQAQQEHVNSHKWVVLEKVHGANFSFNCNGKAVVCSKRTSILKDEEDFFGFQPVLEKHRERIIHLFNEVKTLFATIQSIVVFGEIFGGFYPHPKVKDLSLRPVQREIYYSDKIDFIAFDVWVVDVEKSFWMDYGVAMKLFKKFQLLHCLPLFSGSIDECMKYDTKFNTTIPKLLGLPELPKNICEGVVVKSLEPCYVGEKNNRLIVKIKNHKFEEINPRFAPLSSQNKLNKVDSRTALLENVERYFNHNRLMAVRSKVGEINSENAARVAVLLYKDGMEEFCKDFDKAWQQASEHHEEITKAAKKKAAAVVSDYRKANNE